MRGSFASGCSAFLWQNQVVRAGSGDEPVALGHQARGCMQHPVQAGISVWSARQPALVLSGTVHVQLPAGGRAG